MFIQEIAETINWSGDDAIEIAKLVFVSNSMNSLLAIQTEPFLSEDELKILADQLADAEKAIDLLELVGNNQSAIA